MRYSRAFFKDQNMWNSQVSNSGLYGEVLSKFHLMTLGWSWILWVNSLPVSSCCMIMQVSMWPAELRINRMPWYIRWHAIFKSFRCQREPSNSCRISTRRRLWDSSLGSSPKNYVHTWYSHMWNHASLVKNACSHFL